MLPMDNVNVEMDIMEPNVIVMVVTFVVVLAVSKNNHRLGHLPIRYQAGGYCQNPSGQAGGSGIFSIRPITSWESNLVLVKFSCSTD